MIRTFRSFFFLSATALAAFAQEKAATPAPDLAKKSPPPAAPLNPALPSLFIAGDSTAARGQGDRQQGWAVPFADFFDSSKVNIVNRARGGRSSRTFIAEGSWDRIVGDLKAGDIVLIQFGHNDASPVNEDPSTPKQQMRSRGTIPGLGEATQEIDNVLTNKHETIHTFGWYMEKMIADTKAKGATAIVVSPTVRNIWTDGKIERGPGRYAEWSEAVAKAAGVPYLDLSARMADKLQALGPDATKALYPQDHTHFNLEGAELHAAAVVSLLKTLKPNPVARLLSAKGSDVKAATVAR